MDDETDDQILHAFDGMTEPERERFIPGIYNYCDRWCEQCVFDDRCYTYAIEKRRNARHRERGEDPDDVDIVMQDVAESMGQAMQMLDRMAEQMGVGPNVDAEPETKIRPRPRPKLGEGGPLQERSMRWIKRVGDMVKQVREQLVTVGMDIDRQLDRSEAGPGPEVDEAIARLAALRDACELLARYKFFIPVKIQRAMGCLAITENERSPDALEAKRADGFRTARLVIACLERCETALWQIAEFHEAWRDSALSLLLETQALRTAVDEATPGRASYPRPGFDE